MFLLAVSFVAGVLSVFAACVLPLLPVVVGGSLAAGSRTRVYAIIGSLAVSIVAFTLILKASTALIGVPEELWRYISGFIVVVLGFAILFPSQWSRLPLVNALYVGSNKLLAEGYQRNSLTGDILMGAALGPVFASCSPTYFIILATVLPAQPLLGFAYLIVYALGLSLALFLVFLLGERLIQKVGITLDPGGWFFRGVGALLIVVGVLVFTGTMKDVETWFVERGFDATSLELLLLGSEDTSTPAGIDSAFVPTGMKSEVYQKAPELVSPNGFINTVNGSPITLGEFEGEKVVLVDIWTYSCINCQRTLPYLKMWHEKYKDQGLEIVGVHTPEFAFEKVKANVEKAVREFGLEYPVVLDNEYKTWNAFGNRFWPRKYLIDLDGYIVYDHIGEGGYEETEAAIERALKELAQRKGVSLNLGEDALLEGVIPVDFGKVRSPEVYFGAWRNDLLANGKSGEQGEQSFELPGSPIQNALYLGGAWNIAYEYAEGTTGSQILFRYSAKNAYMVASAPSGASLQIWLDGALTRTIEVRDHQLYTLVEGLEYGEHTLELRIQGEGFEAYTFTFG